MTEQEYDELYEEVMKFLKEVNPCNVVNGKCTRGQEGGQNFCCGSSNSKERDACKHCGDNGCTADKPLACRLWLCEEAERKLNFVNYRKLYSFRKSAGVFGDGETMFRVTKQESFDIYNKLKLTKEYYGSR